LKRCELHGIDFAVGRDESAPRAITVRPASGELEAEVLSYELNGRNLVDTLLLAQAYDIFSRSLDSYGLKYLAQHFGFASPDRVYIPGNKISWHWDHEPKQLLQYALDDIDETRLLSEHLSPSYFYLSQICPLPYSTVTRSGSTVKIESMLLREYMRQRHSVPKPSSGLQTTGGYSDIFLTGVLSDVIHADVESLYPSIIVSNNIMPRHDGLKIFPTLLQQLLAMRLKAKQSMREAEDPLLRSKYDAMQSSYKILINSFYGYLGYSKGLFSDFVQADVVTTTGQKLLRDIMNQVGLYNGTVIEVDTDGLYFLPPDNVRGEAQESAFVHRLSDSLPQGISLAYTGHYPKMLSYKKKNYALRDGNGKIIIKGSSLTSRSLERFIRSYLRQCVDCLLREDIGGMHNLYVATVNELRNHQLNVYEFCRTERLHESIERYNNGIAAALRKPAAVYEVAKRSGLSARVGQSIAYYVTGSHQNVRIIDNCRLVEEWDSNFPDENTSYYISRLNDASSKFELFFLPQHFTMIFSVDSLFGFSTEGIHILTKTVQAEETISPETEEEESDGFGIWIDNQKT
jgi:DNA polymerase elongation subunit (family B)